MAATMNDLHKVSAESADSLSSAFDLFSTPHTHTSVLRSDWVEVYPVRETTHDTLEFDIGGSADQYTDLASTFLYVEAKVTKENGTNLEADPPVAVGDNFFHSLFSTVSVRFNNADVEFEGNYPHRAYLETLLNYGNPSKKTFLWPSSGWSGDDSVGRAQANVVGDDFTARKARIGDSKTLSFYGKLHLSSCNLDRYLPPSVRVRFQLKRTDPAFCLLSANDAPAAGASIAITKSVFYVKKLTANPALQKAQTEQMSLRGAQVKLPFPRVKTQFHVISAGVSDWRQNLDYHAQRPKRVFIALVDHAAKTGTYPTNPFLFANNGVSMVDMQINGLPVTAKYTPNYTTNAYAREFMNLYRACGKSDTDTTNGIDYENYKSRFAIYAFETSADDGADSGFSLVGKGTVSIHISFATALAEPVSAFIYMEKDDLVSIDGLDGSVSMVARVL